MNIALVGLGYWGPHYARIVGEMPECTLTWCCDTSPTALQLAERRYPWVRRTSDLETVLSDEAVDAVILATPTETHADLILRCLAAEKHVLVEKPLATSTEECDEIDRHTNGQVVMVGHTFVYNPAVIELRRMIASGALGHILYLTSVRTGLGPIRNDVNVLWDLGPHDVSIFLDLLGNSPISVSAIGQHYLRDGAEDVVYLHVRFADDVMAHVHLSWLDPYKVRQTTVVGSRQMAVFNDVAADERLKIFDRGASYATPSEESRGQSYGEYRAVLRNGAITVPYLAHREPLAEQLNEFVACVRERRRPYSGSDEARQVIAVLEAAQLSLDCGGMPVPIAGEGDQSRNGGGTRGTPAGQTWLRR
jgi:predicted dehydrogenase